MPPKLLYFLYFCGANSNPCGANTNLAELIPGTNPFLVEELLCDSIFHLTDRPNVEEQHSKIKQVF